jgi:hypothetical protein
MVAAVTVARTVVAAKPFSNVPIFREGRPCSSVVRVFRLSMDIAVRVRVILLVARKNFSLSGGPAFSGYPVDCRSDRRT